MELAEGADPYYKVLLESYSPVDSSISNCVPGWHYEPDVRPISVSLCGAGDEPNLCQAGFLRWALR